MNLPTAFLDELRSRVSLTTVVGRKVHWDQRKSNTAKGDMWAPCPFHKEKTASFHVLNNEGYYYCFGCHAKGDAITFMKDSENLSFIEAVEALAREAGMKMPTRDPAGQKRIGEHTLMLEVMEKAVRYFRIMLNSKSGLEAMDYLKKRGILEDTQMQFDLGFAPNSRNGLFDSMTKQGVSTDELVSCGLCIKPDDGSTPYDRFRNRLIFPIRDHRGRCIAFGARALDKNARAKYLNSPETALFNKGRSLYNLHQSRSALGRSHPLIVAEGYMDVISLVQAGFSTAVAPLGTAITEDQLRMMWSLDPEPVVALDGDKAGLRAAYRLLDTSLPLLETGRALRFALMPPGKDPDDVIQHEGIQGFQNLLDQAIPFVDLLWLREIDGQIFDSPDRKALLEKTLRSKVLLIKDISLRRNYEFALQTKRREFFRLQGGIKTGVKGQLKISKSLSATQMTKSSSLASGNDFSEDRLRESVIIAALINCPKAVFFMEEELQDFEFKNSSYNDILGQLYRFKPTTRREAEEKISEYLGVGTINHIWSENYVKIAPCMKWPENVDGTCLTVREELQKLKNSRGVAEELAEISQSLDQKVDDTSIWRICRAVEAKNKNPLPGSEDKANYDLADNGVRIDRNERDDFKAFLSEISFLEKKK